jgi:small subunit ribosomal protein S9
LIDEERTEQDDEQPDEQQGGEVPAEQAEEAAPEQTEETPAEEVASPAEQQPAGEEQPPAEEPPAAEEQPPAEEAPAAEEQPVPAEQPAAERDKSEGKKEVVPGAELEPIAIEPEAELSAEERARREAEEEERRRLEAEFTAEEVSEQPVAAKPAKLSGDASYQATGKRKSSVARVLLRPGSGTIEVNERKLEEYFPRSYLQSVAKQPLVQTGYEGNVDVRVRVHGGGISGQAAAVRHGLARALADVDPELRKELKRRGMLTRDARVKERRKAGLKKARKRPQFSKR